MCLCVCVCIYYVCVCNSVYCCLPYSSYKALYYFQWHVLCVTAFLEGDSTVGILSACQSWFVYMYSSFLSVCVVYVCLQKNDFTHIMSYCGTHARTQSYSLTVFPKIINVFFPSSAHSNRALLYGGSLVLSLSSRPTSDTSSLISTSSWDLSLTLESSWVTWRARRGCILCWWSRCSWRWDCGLMGVA